MRNRQPFKKHRRLAVGLALSGLLVGCMFLPQTRSDDSAQCHLSTASFTLQAVPLEVNVSTAGCSNDAACVIAELATVPLGSFIVSGSIVAVGNTVHWVEAQGRCSESTTHQAVNQLLASTKAVGGKLLKTSAEAMAWIKRFSSTSQGAALPEHS